MSSLRSGLTRRDLPRSHNLTVSHILLPPTQIGAVLSHPFITPFSISSLPGFIFFDIPLFHIDFLGSLPLNSVMFPKKPLLPSPAPNSGW